jgi:hypothetical protein
MAELTWYIWMCRITTTTAWWKVGRSFIGLRGDSSWTAQFDLRGKHPTPSTRTRQSPSTITFLTVSVVDFCRFQA